MLLHEFVREAAVKKYGNEHGSDKELAVAVHSALETKESVKFVTVQGRISKLLNGNPEGRDFFYDDKQAHRLGVLAETLGTDTAKLRALDEQLVLVLDPRFPPEVGEFLRHRMAHAKAAFCIAVPEEGEHVRTSLRDEAKRYRYAKVLLSVAEEDAFFEGAAIATARLVKRPLGYIVQGHEDLYAMPPPPEPALFDAKGQVQVPVRSDHGLGPLQRIMGWEFCQKAERELADGISPILSLEQAVRWFVEANSKADGMSGSRRPYVEFAGGPAHNDFPYVTSGTKIWQAFGKVYADGPLAPAFANFIGTCHPVLPPPWREPLVAVAALFDDPWQFERELQDMTHPAVEALFAALAPDPVALGLSASQSCSQDLRPHVRSWLGSEVKAAKEALRESVKWKDWKHKSAFAPISVAFDATMKKLRPGTGPTRLPNHAERVAIDARIAAILEHGFEEGGIPAASLLHLLHRALRAPVACATPPAGAEPHLAFDVGYERILELRSAPLRGAPRPLVLVGGAYERNCWEPTWFWGGDVLVSLQFHESRHLQGAAPPPVAGQAVDQAPGRTAIES